MAAALLPSVAFSHANLVLLPVRSSSVLCGSRRRPHRTRPRRVQALRQTGCRIVAEKSDIYRAIGTAVKTARDVLEAGTKLVPESVPRPLAQAGVAVIGVLLFTYVLKSIFSVALFILAIGGVSYFIFLSSNKDDDQGSGGGPSNDRTPDVTLEEARRIMEKYK